MWPEEEKKFNLSELILVSDEETNLLGPIFISVS